MNHCVVYFLVLASSSTEDGYAEKATYRPRIGFEGLLYFIHHNNAWNYLETNKNETRKESEKEKNHNK